MPLPGQVLCPHHPGPYVHHQESCTLGTLSTLAASLAFFQSPNLLLHSKRHASLQYTTLGHLKTSGRFVFPKPSLERGPVIAVVTAVHLVTGVVWVLLERKGYLRSLKDGGPTASLARQSSSPVIVSVGRRNKKNTLVFIHICFNVYQTSARHCDGCWGYSSMSKTHPSQGRTEGELQREKLNNRCTLKCIGAKRREKQTSRGLRSTEKIWKIKSF